MTVKEVSVFTSELPFFLFGFNAKKSQVINQIWVNYKLGKSDTVHMHDCEMRANYKIKNKN